MPEEKVPNWVRDVLLIYVIGTCNPADVLRTAVESHGHIPKSLPSLFSSSLLGNSEVGGDGDIRELLVLVRY